jgi:hypothetical protein
MPPNDMPGYKPQGGQLPPMNPPGPISGDTLDAEKLYQQARALVDVEKTISGVIDTMRKAGHEFETIQKVLNKRENMSLSLGDVQRRSKEYNLSLKDMASMSLPQAAKNIRGLSTSLLNLLGPMTSVSAAFTVIKTSMDAFASLNKSASIYTTQSGLGMRGGTPAYKDRDAMLSMRKELNGMGIAGEDADKVFSASAREFGRSTSMPQLNAINSGAAGLSQQANIPVEKAVEFISQLAYAGGDLQKFETALQNTATIGKFESSQEKVTQTMIDLWQATRFLPGGMDRLLRSTKKYDKELLAGIVNPQEIAKMNKGVQDIGLGDGMRILGLLENVGVKVKGVDRNKDAYAQVSAMQNNPQNVLDALEEGIPKFAARMTGRGADSASINEVIKMFGPMLSEGITEKLRFKGVVGGKLADESSLQKSLGPLAQAAKNNFDATKGFTTGLQQAIKALGIFGSALANEAASVKGAQGAGRAAANLLDPSGLGRMALDVGR